MKITDEVIIKALSDGKHIKRASSQFLIDYYLDMGVIFKQTTDKTKRHLFCAAAFSLDYLTADDWEIVEG